MSGRAALVTIVLLAVGTPSALALAPAAPPALPVFDSTRIYDRTQFEAAIVPYTQAIARNANDARAHYWLGVAYLHMAHLRRLGLAPFAADFARRAVASLEQSLRLQAAAEVMLALLDAYSMVGDHGRYTALISRVASMAQPIPIK